MLRFLKIFLFVAIFATCFGIAFAGFYLFMRLNKGTAPVAGAGAGATTETVVAQQPAAKGGEVSDLVQDYKRAQEQKNATPAPVAGQPAATSTAGGQVAAAGATPAKPVPTPDPMKKLIRENRTGRKWVALTFDDGPHAEFTPKFIELLKSKNVRATFFLIGPNVEQHPDLAKQLVDNGFELGNHTSKHLYLSKQSPEKVREELVSTSDAIKNATGANVSIMRPPYGAANPMVQKICEEMGLKIITWSIDTDDWRKTTNEDQMTSNVMKNVTDGSIILMHDRYEKSFNTTAQIIDKLRAQGYEFATVSELLGFKKRGESPHSGAPAAPATASAPAATPAAAPAVATQAAPGGNALPAPGNAGADAKPAASENKLPAPQGAAKSQAAMPKVSADKVTAP